MNSIDGNKELKKLNSPKCKLFSKLKINRPTKLKGKYKLPEDNSMTKKKTINSKFEV